MWPAYCVAGLLCGRLAVWPAGCVACWLYGWLSGWLAVWPACCAPCWLCQTLFAFSAGCVASWLAVQPSGLLPGCMRPAGCVAVWLWWQGFKKNICNLQHTFYYTQVPSISLLGQAKSDIDWPFGLQSLLDLRPSWVLLASSRYLLGCLCEKCHNLTLLVRYE